MKKRIVAVILLVLLLASLSTAALATQPETENLELSGNPAFTVEDYIGNFTSYAKTGSTVNLPVARSTSENAANVVGVVLDYKTNSPIVGATVSVGNISVQTDDQGRFQIVNMPNGEYTWNVTAQNYMNGQYVGYSIDAQSGTTIFTFYIGVDCVIVKDRNELEHRDAAVLPDTELMPVSIDVVDTAQLSSIPSIASTVNVLSNGVVTNVGRRQYIYTVISSELYDASYYEGLGLTEAQVKQLYIAQGIASNTWLEYALSVYSNHSGTSYKVCDQSCCQCYDPTKVTSLAIEASGELMQHSLTNPVSFKMLLYHPNSSSYGYIWGAFSSACYSQGTLTYGSTQPALQGKSCTDLTYGDPAGSHRYGMCQMGAAQRAKDGNTYLQILNYYYTNCVVVDCPTN